MGSFEVARPRAQDSEAPPASASAERARVLVVDDDKRNLLAIQNVLEDLGDVVVASSGEEALRYLLKGDFAVILLDVLMPGMDGYETAEIIRAREHTRRIPIVFLSAVNKEPAHLMRGYTMGAVDYVFKPVEPVVLRSKVAVFVDLFLKTREVERKARAEQELLDANLRANAERLRVEQELRFAEQRQAAILKSLPILVYVEEIGSSSRTPDVVGGNFQSFTGFRMEDIASDPGFWTERLHPEDRERVQAGIRNRDRTGAMAIEYRWRCADDRYKHLLDQAVLLRDAEGKPIQIAGTLLDVSDRKELENQLLQARKMDAIGKLTGGIAHDFNNLLAAVLGGIGMIERRIRLDEEQQKILGMTRHAAEQGSELVARLLAFARRQQLEPARIEMERLSSTVTDLLSHTLGGLVQLEWHLDPDLWPAYADETQLELALMNLVINARDAMPDGGAVTVSAANRTAGRGDGELRKGDYVVVTVTDTGCGIPAEVLEQVTEPFFTTKEIGKGTGLGLSMVYGFARQSGGTLRIESEVGAGTRVEIWLPRHETTEMPLAPQGVATAPVRPSRKLRVLLADDHDGVRATASAMLEDMGHEVVSVPDGVSMFGLFEKNPDAFDILISDYAMPLVSGGEILRKVDRMRPGFPSLIISGYADEGAIDRIPAHVRVLPKPFTANGLCAAIEAVVENASARDRGKRRAAE